MEPHAHSSNENLDARVAKLFDPGVDLKTKITVAGEIRDAIENIRDLESSRVFPVLIPNVVDFLSNGEPSFRKDALEYQFRRVNLEILNRLPFLESVRPHATSIFACMLHLLRNDNEDNAITACKTIMDVVKAWKCLTEQTLADFMSILQQVLSNMKTVIPEVLSEDSALVDPNSVPRSSRSFKMLSEMGLVMVVFAQTHRALLTPAILQTTIASIFEFLALESPAQKSARENSEAMENIWAGMAPTIKNTTTYADFLNAEIKLLSYVAWIMRFATDQSDNYGETMVLLSMRLLQDCPANSVSLRRELISVFRHLISTPHRRVLVGQLDKLLDDRVLFGTGLASRELLRVPLYSAMADLFHHLKADFTGPQLSRIVNIYSRLLHDPALPTSLHTLFAKMMFHLVDVLTAKEAAPDAGKTLNALLETSLERLEALSTVHEEILSAEKPKPLGQSTVDRAFIEKARPIGGAAFAVDKPEDVLLESRLLFKTLLHGFRVIITGLKKVNAPVPDGTSMFRLFEGCIRCMAFFDLDSRVSELSESIEWFCPILYELNLHVFQEVWMHKIGFFFDFAQKRIPMLNICQTILAREAVSPTLLAIILKFLVDRLALLGDYDDHRAAATIRLFKMAFHSVVLFPPLNEPILASHLAKLLMDCFPLAAKAAKPTHYFHLLRVLFRSIGGGGGRFELLYNQLLPLLPEMLQCLNQQLLSSEGTTRDLIVELCLTVPLRLTHLLPHLSYLMQPLALALRGGPDVVSQGLRTLELCIDNLTPDFLDPTLNSVLRELMEALHSHLKPLPANHIIAHTAIRILGKLGGRNRRLLTKQPALEYIHHSDVAKFPISFGGDSGKLALDPVSKVACQALRKRSSDVIPAYDFIQSSISVILHEGIAGRNTEDLFTHLLEGLFDAMHIAEVEEQATQFVRKLSSTIFENEIRLNHGRDLPPRVYTSPLLSAFLSALPHALAREASDEALKSRDLVASLVNELVGMKDQSNISLQDIQPLLQLIASRFIALSLEDSWAHKNGACMGIKIMVATPEVGSAWVVERDLDLVRSLLHILKDVSPDIPRDNSGIINLLENILRISHADSDFSSDAPSSARNKVIFFAGLFFADLNSPNPVVRQASQRCINILVELSRKTAAEILMPHRDRMHHTLFTKPLRALPSPSQIGKIEATRYCVSLDPPLIELGDELLRLLHETLALADADDAALVGRVGSRQNSLEVTKLRVACIRLLTASMPLTDFFSRQHQTRQRVTGVYFKSLYSPSQEVKEVAHEGLRMVLLHQSRLPKELLQTGLRPILMNLADPKRLSVPGLEGLARLLELLTNYFKVEIGHKLLDHFRIVADPQLLQSSSRLPLAENEGISKLVCLANIFHLLPSAANTFLEQLVNLIVNTEAQMHFSGKSPFSEPLAKYLDRYSEEGITYFMEQLHFPRHVRTLRSILQARLAPNLERELASRTSFMIARFRSQSNLLLPTLLLFSDMAAISPGWTQENDYVMDTLLEIWRSEVQHVDQNGLHSESLQRHSLILSIFKATLEQSPRIDLLFDVVDIYTRNLDLDRVHITKFLYEHVAMSEDLVFRRNVLMRFLTWFEDTSMSWSHKASFIRYIITPTLLVHASRSQPSAALIDSTFVDNIQRLIWRRIEMDTFANTDDMFKIELLHFTTVLVHHYTQLVEPVKKHIIKCAWHYISISDDPIVKQTAYLLTARSFAAWLSPQKFILRAWTGLLRIPYEGRAFVRQEALTTLVGPLLASETNDTGYPQWATTARRLLVEEGFSQAMTIYHLVVKESDLFYPVRALFVPHIVSSLSKLGLTSSTTQDSRLLSVELLHVVFAWDLKAAKELQEAMSDEQRWIMPQAYKEIIVGYLIRLTTQQDHAKNPISARALLLLQSMVGPKGWNDDVAYGLRFFEKALEQTDLTDQTIPQAIAAAKTLHVISSEQSDSWYMANASKLQLLVRKGMTAEDFNLQDALHPIVDRLLRLYPLPKEEEEVHHGALSDFHSFVQGAIGEGLRNANLSRGALLMLKSVVQVVPQRIEPFSAAIVKALAKLTKDHVHPPTPVSQAVFETQIRLLMIMLDICQLSMSFLGGESRRFLLTNIIVLIDKSKHPPLCRYILDMCRSWAFAKQDPYPTMKEKATVLQKMTVFETKNDILFQAYLELIYDIYTDPSLRRSDLTSRLEQSFLLGCCAKDHALRERFVDLFDVSVPRSLFSRLVYICGVQSWEALCDHNWIPLALHLLLGAVEVDSSMSHRQQPNQIELAISRPRTQAIVRSMQKLIALDIQAAHETWISIFPVAWAALSRREQTDVTHHMINLLSKDYHSKQAELHPNVIQTLLGGILACSPPMILPPHLLKYLAKTFGAWHVTLEILTNSLEHAKEDEPSTRDYVYDSLADVYGELAEDDIFYGLWRYRSIQPETNIAIAFEQTGMWDQACTAYESAQSRSRAGTIPFSESEYCLWEDHWVLSAEKLQQWEVLYELGRSEGNHELMLESAWRTKDWTENRETLEEQISQLSEAPTPRRRIFEAFIALLKTPAALDKNTEFTKILEDAMQLSLRKWVALPSNMSPAHVPLLQHFQQFVELQEAVQIFGSLSQTNASNLEKKSSELKMVLQAWRDRLPNLHDDISIWSDLVAWRQNVFHAINNAYIPLIQNTNGGNNTSNTYGYRGYHETAWIINRFAHVARKHGLLDVCFSSLNKIYTLPNIEISEAFLKLREQARCYYNKPNELQAGLEVINNTNLMYFSTAQKAEFSTLKGMFYARLSRNDDANTAFGQAVQLDMNQAKAWAEWGRYNDKMFKENPNDLSLANNAVSCYLQAAGQYKSAKCRPLLARILWLLSLDDGSFTISRAFDTYKGEAAFWYWITLIPQLCTSIAHREVKQARYILHNLARHYPQALFFQMRTTREEMYALRKQATMRAAMTQAAVAPINGDATRPPQTASDAPSEASPTAPSSSNGAQPESQEQRTTVDADNSVQRPTWEYMEEIVQLIKTAFPLLILSMETLSDQFLSKFKPTNEDDVYRSMNAFIWSDAIQNIILRSMTPDDEGQLTPQTVNNLMRLATIFNGQPRKEFEADFIANKPTIYELLQRLQKWRDRSEKAVDNRPRFQSMDNLGHYWTEFQYAKVDEIEVFGQYTEEKESNQNFIKIQKFYPKFENYKSAGVTWKRITIIGNDHSRTSFHVQTPCHRQCRREEKVMQIFRTFNGVLARKKESRKRNLHFHLPAIVAFSANLRLIQTDSSYFSLGDVYDLHCERSGFSREEPLLYGADKCRKVLRDFRDQSGRQPAKPEYIIGKKIIFDEVTTKMIPDDILNRYMIQIMDGPSDLWRIRKQFALQIAACSFMTYVVCLSGRVPGRFNMSRTTGQIAMSEVLPGIASQNPLFVTHDVVPFRLTPNMQTFVGPIFTEGLLAVGIMSIARCLTEPEYDLDYNLCLFSRDEVAGWMALRGRTWTPDTMFRQSVSLNIEAIVKRAESMACKIEREQALQNSPLAVPVLQTVTNLISTATNPTQLVKMGDTFYPWF